METIDYNKLTEDSKIKVKIGEVDKEFDITTEATLTHGHGMPGQYGFALSDKEKSIVKWFVEKFKIEDYEQIVDSFFEENGLKSSDLNGFISGIRYFKLWTKTAEEESGFPDLTLSGKYGEIDFTLNFRKKKLVQIINQRRLKYNDKNQVVEIRHYGITGDAGSRETFKYNDAGRKIESCDYNSNGDLRTIAKFNDKGVRTVYCQYDDEGCLTFKRIVDDNNRLLEEYFHSEYGVPYHYICTRDVDGNLIEANKYNGDEMLESKETYDQDGHSVYYYNVENGNLEEIQKFDKNNRLISKTTYNPDGSIVYEQNEGDE